MAELPPSPPPAPEAPPAPAPAAKAPENHGGLLGRLKKLMGTDKKLTEETSTGHVGPGGTYAVEQPYGKQLDNLSQSLNSPKPEAAAVENKGEVIPGHKEVVQAEMASVKQSDEDALAKLRADLAGVKGPGESGLSQSVSDEKVKTDIAAMEEQFGASGNKGDEKSGMSFPKKVGVVGALAGAGLGVGATTVGAAETVPTTPDSATHVVVDTPVNTLPDNPSELTAAHLGLSGSTSENQPGDISIGGETKDDSGNIAITTETQEAGAAADGGVSGNPDNLDAAPGKDEVEPAKADTAGATESTVAPASTEGAGDAPTPTEAPVTAETKTITSDVRSLFDSPDSSPVSVTKAGSGENENHPKEVKGGDTLNSEATLNAEGKQKLQEFMTEKGLTDPVEALKQMGVMDLAYARPVPADGDLNRFDESVKQYLLAQGGVKSYDAETGTIHFSTTLPDKLTKERAEQILGRPLAEGETAVAACQDFERVMLGEGGVAPTELAGDTGVKFLDFERPDGTRVQSRIANTNTLCSFEIEQPAPPVEEAPPTPETPPTTVVETPPPPVGLIPPTDLSRPPVRLPDTGASSQTDRFASMIAGREADVPLPGEGMAEDLAVAGALGLAGAGALSADALRKRRIAKGENPLVDDAKDAAADAVSRMGEPKAESADVSGAEVADLVKEMDEVTAELDDAQGEVAVATQKFMKVKEKWNKLKDRFKTVMNSGAETSAYARKQLDTFGPLEKGATVSELPKAPDTGSADQKAA